MENSDKNEISNLLKTSRGQMEGVIKMIEDERYCVDISKQILSIQALLKKANLKIIDQHIKHCIREAFAEGNERADEKIDEIIHLINKYAK